MEQENPKVWREAPRARALRLLQNWIKTGVFKKGDILPSEVQMSLRLGVSLATTRRAMAMIEDEGLIAKKGKRSRIVVGTTATFALSDTILVFTVDRPTPASTLATKHSGFIKDIGHGAIRAVGEMGCHAMILQPGYTKLDGFARLLDQRPKGILIPEIDNFAHFSEFFLQLAPLMKEAGIPFVACNDHSIFHPYDRVVFDQEAGEYEITKWLIGRGRRHILCVFRQARPELAQARYAGYCRAMGEAGLAPLPVFWDEMGETPIDDPETAFRVRHAYFRGCLNPYLAENPHIDAIVTTNDRQAFEIGAAFRAIGTLDDERILIAGYDNFYQEADAWERDLCPAIPAATVDKQNHLAGTEMVRLLFDRIEGRLSSEPQTRTVAPIFIPLR